MGEVYRATDTTLKRAVAIKVLPDAVADDAERLARFQREAEMLAALNHPNIAHIHGLEKHAGLTSLVMELVEGPTLADRIEKGPIPLDETVLIARQIAEALEAAHEQGIVHRDLKPANVKLRSDGTVKVLDFGLAKTMERPGADSASASMAPTITSPAMTQQGVILGTAAYMSPEQARGRPVDKRADIWAFGIVLVEMLTGKAVFTGETVTDLLAAVVTREPDLSALPPAAPPRLRELLRRCLQKDPKQRLRDIGDARLELASLTDPVTTVRDHRSLPLVAGLAGAIGIVVGAAAVWMAQPAPEATVVQQLDVLPRAAEEVDFWLTGPTISPDGRSLLIPGPQALSVRGLADTDERELRGTEGASFAAWSPDSTAVAWIARRRLWRMPIAGGQPTAIATVPLSVSGAGALAWARDGRILLAGSAEALILEVPATGGQLKTTLAAVPNVDRDLHAMVVLPDGRTVVAVKHLPEQPPNLLVSIDLTTGASQELVRFDGGQIDQPAWSPTGHVMIQRSNPERAIWAIPFDLETGRRTGEPFLAIPSGGRPSTAHDGTLAYVRGGPQPWRQLVRVERDGRITATIGAPQSRLEYPSIDPTGRFALADIESEGQSDLWMWDTSRGTRTQISAPGNVDWHGVWTPDGKSALWALADTDALVLKRLGTGEQQRVGAGQFPHIAPDGRSFVATRVGGNGTYDLFTGRLDSPETNTLVGSAAQESEGRISRDGRLIAYTSDETGVVEVFVDSFPALSARLQISIGGGHTPRWGGSGELFFIAGDRLMTARLSGTPPTVVTAPAALFSLREAGLIALPNSFDVDGSGRLLMLRGTPRPDGPPLITIVTGILPQLRPRD
jgi:Tol biopolymer transport system component